LKRADEIGPGQLLDGASSSLLAKTVRQVGVAEDTDYGVGDRRNVQGIDEQPRHAVENGVRNAP
jgi:hypothetical protein